MIWDLLKLSLGADLTFFGPKAVPNTTTWRQREFSHLNRIISRQLPLSFGSHLTEKYISSFGGIERKLCSAFSLLPMSFRSTNVKPLSVGHFTISNVWLIGCGLDITNVSVLLLPTFTVPKDILGIAAKWVSLRVGASGSGERGILGEFLQGLYHWARFEWTLLTSWQFSLLGVNLGSNIV